jgi:hypothetical protein
MLARIFVLLLLLFSPLAAFAQAAPAKSSTVTAAMPTPDDRARQWLTLVDDGNYVQSWNEAASAYKKDHPAPAWSKQIAALRGPLGAVVTRDLKSVDLSRSQLAIVRYDTDFAHKSGTVETVTLAFEKGAWAVAGYTIH